MNISLYISPFIKSFLIAVILSITLIWLSGKINGRNKKSNKHSSWGKINRLGGVAIIGSFLFAILLDKNLFISNELWGIIMASVFILVIGLWDDFRKLSWKVQLFFQIAIAAFVFIMGVRVEYVTNPFGGYIFLNLGHYLIPSLLFVIFWLLILINATNWLDGIDGLSGGVGLIVALTIFFLALKPEVNQPPVGIIAMALVGSLGGFLIFNYHPAKILAGTSGSMFLGFILAVLAIFAGAKIATALLVMAIPIIDAFWVIGDRIRSGKSIFEADSRHLHHKLLKLGWSQKKITLFFYTITLAIALVALNTKAMGKIIAISLVVIIMVSAFIYIDKKLKNAKISLA